MRKTMRVFWTVFLSFLFLFAVLYGVKEPGTRISPEIREEASDSSAGVFVFPAALRFIGEEAFEGTAANSAVFSDSFETLGEKAFANANALKAVLFPEETVFIAENAFEGATELTVYGVPGSYADAWAKAQGFCFVSISALNRENGESGQLRRSTRLLAFILLTAALLLMNRQSAYRIKKREEVRLPPYGRPEMPVLDYVFP